jgi:Ca2+/Na+ antiporter
MELSQLVKSFSSVGDWIGSITEKIIKFLAERGLVASQLTSKIIFILLCSVIIYFVLSVLTITKKFIKWIIVILLVILILSVIISIFP